jgi:hypothetical protein
LKHTVFHSQQCHYKNNESDLAIVVNLNMQSFLPEIVDPARPDGYWTEAFPFESGSSHPPDVIGYGLGTSDSKSKIELYLNPHRNSSQ